MKNYSVTKKRKTQGFSLVELMIAIAMISILATMATSLFTTYATRSRTAEAFSLVPKITRGVVEYYEKNGSFVDLVGVNIPPGTLPVTADFNVGNWPDIGFSVSGDILFGYRGYASGSDFIVEAQGDQDGDGDLSLFSITITPVAGVGNSVRAGLVFHFDELE